MGNKIELAFWNGDVEKLQVYTDNMTWRQLYMQHYHRPGVFGAHVQHILVFRKHTNNRLYWNLAYHLNMPEDVNATFSQGFTAWNLAEAGRDPYTISWWKIHLCVIMDRGLFRVLVKSNHIEAQLQEYFASGSRFDLLQRFRNIGKGIDSLISSSTLSGPLYPGAPEHLTPLYFAVIANNVGVLKELLARGARAYPHPRAPADNYSLLHVAARMDHASMIPLLVQAGCCVNEDAHPTPGHFRTPFVVAAHYGNLCSLKVLMGMASFVFTPEQGYWSLAAAAQNGQFHVLSTLMKLCCRLLGNPSLFLYKTDFQSARLIEGDEDSDAISVFHGAASFNQHGALRTLIRCYKQFIGGDFPRIGISLMNNAVLAGSADTVAVLFEEGLVDLSSEDPCGPNNPLRTAVYYLEMGVLRVLMSSKCARFIPVSFSKGLLHFALALRAIHRKALLSLRDSVQQNNQIPLSFMAGLINMGCSIRSVHGEHGLLPIHEASRRNDPKAVQLLIDYGCPPNAFTQSSSGYRFSPMHIAAEHDSSDVIEVLAVANGCSVDFHHPLEDPPLHVAIAHGSLNAVETLLWLGASTSSRANSRCLPSPIHTALVAAQLTAIDHLVKYGANVSEFKCHPEHAAEISLISEINENLVKGGAATNPDTLLPERSSDSDIPFDKIYQYFASHQVYQTSVPPLFFAVLGLPDTCTAEHRITVIKKLVSCGADINRQYEHADISTFGLACRYGLYEEVKCLIQMGADLEVRTNSGRCPIHLAITHNRLKVVELLLDSGCRSANSPVMCCGEPDLTPFQLACTLRCPGILKALAVKVTDINQKTTDELSPLHLALVHPSVLLYSTADGSEACSAPLTLPLERENETIQTLLDLQCDVNAQDDEGVTPLDYAIHYHLKKIVFLLTKAGALKGTKITDREELRRHIESVERRLAGVTAKFDVVEKNVQAITDSYSRPESRSHHLDTETHVVQSTLRTIYTDFIKHAEAREMASSLKKQGLIPASVEAKIKEATDVPTSNGHLYDHFFTQATPSTLDILCRVLKAQVGRPATSQLGGRMHAELNRLQLLLV